MIKQFKLPLLVMVLMFSGFLVTAQESESDPYSDYSYLWEDSKSKTKEAKLKAKEEKKRQKELDKLRKKGLLPDSISTQEPTVALDSIPNEENTVATDTLPETPYPATDSVDSPDSIPDTVINRDSIPEPQTPVIEEEPEDESFDVDDLDKPSKEKKRLEGKPIHDFRGGFGNTPTGGSFNGGFNFTQIGNKHYVGMTLNPDFSIGKVGVGLNIPILYGLEEQKIRTEIFKDGVGAARLITYIRYGVQKKDHVYVKVGQLDNTMVGYGGLINNYTNTTSFEKRKVGLHTDLNWRYLVGIEGLYSDFNPQSFNLFALRPYVRPLGMLSIPVINTLELGTTIIRDKDQTKNILSDGSTQSYDFTKEGVGAFGLDVGLTLLRVPFIQINLFANYSKLNASDSLKSYLNAASVFVSDPSSPLSDGYSDGSGKSVGLNFRFNFIANVMSTDLRIERLSYTDHYLPQFFDATYEIDKDSKLLMLGTAEEMSGIYGSLTGQILQKVQIGGSLMIPDNISEATPATVRVNADLDRLGEKISMHASYIKGNLSDLGDAFTFDERSLAKVRFIYHMNKFLAAGLDYYWAFTPTADGGYKAEKYVSPYFGLSIAF